MQTGGPIALALRRFDQNGDVPTDPVTIESLERRFFGVDGDARAR